MSKFDFPMEIKSYGSPLALCKGYFWKCDENIFSWEKKDRKDFKGEINCIQTSCPRVDVNVYIYEDNKPIKSYEEHTGWGDPEITLGYVNSNGVWWFGDYIDDKLVSIGKGEPNIDDDWEDLQVEDSGMIIHSLDQKMKDTFL